MIACFAWTNPQIINITNAFLNLYPDEAGDIYIYMGRHISFRLIDAIKKSGIYDNVFCVDPISINYNLLPLGRIKKVRALFQKKAFHKAYGRILDRQCGGKVYNRVLLAWFYTENVFFLDYWAKSSPNLAITLVDEGTGSYCYHKKDILFPMSLIPSKKERIKRWMNEGNLSRKFSRNIDSFALYRPEFCRKDVDFTKLQLPVINAEGNPVMYQILRDSVFGLNDQHFVNYNKKDAFYFTTYSVGNSSFEEKSTLILKNLVKSVGADNLAVKVHTGNTIHRNEFAASYQNRIYIDRDIYIFEGLYAQLEHPEDKILISCLSTAAITPKFVFGMEPYVIFTFRLYDTYRQIGVERDDHMAKAVMDAYSDKSRVMIPNSFAELREMVSSIIQKQHPERSQNTSEIDELEEYIAPGKLNEYTLTINTATDLTEILRNWKGTAVINGTVSFAPESKKDEAQENGGRNV